MGNPFFTGSFGFRIRNQRRFYSAGQAGWTQAGSDSVIHKAIFTNSKIACSYSGKSGKSGNTGIGEIISSGTDYSMCLWTNFTTFFFRYSQDRLFQSAFLFFAEIAWSLSGTGGNYFRT